MIADIPRLFDKLYTVLADAKFLNKEIAGTDVAFYVQSYNAENQFAVDNQILPLIKRLSDHGIDAKEIKLYKLAINIIKDEGLLESVFENEKEHSKADFLENISGVVNSEELSKAVERAIGNEKPQIVFLTGIGALFPILRAHTLIENLLSKLKDPSIVMFYPGTYDQYSFSLFQKLQPENHYRAFDLNSLIKDNK